MVSGAAFGGVTPDEVIDGLLAQVRCHAIARERPAGLGTSHCPADGRPRAGRGPRAAAAAHPSRPGVLALAAVTLGMSLWLNWQEFTQLGTVAFALLGLGLVWRCIPGSPTARLEVRPDRLVEGSAPPTGILHVQAGPVPMLFPNHRPCRDECGVAPAAVPRTHARQPSRCRCRPCVEASIASDP